MHWFSPTTVRDFKEIGYTIVPSCSHLFVCSHFAVLEIGYLADHVGSVRRTLARNAEVRARGEGHTIDGSGYKRRRRR